MAVLSFIAVLNSLNERVRSDLSAKVSRNTPLVRASFLPPRASCCTSSPDKQPDAVEQAVKQTFACGRNAGYRFPRQED